MSRKSHVTSFTHGLNVGFSNEIDWSCFHQHNNEIELAFHPRGTSIYRFGGRLEKIEQDETILYWGAIPHQAVDLVPNDSCYYLTVPISLFVQMSLPSGFVNRIFSGELLRQVDSVFRQVDLLLFEKWGNSDIEIDSQKRKAFMHWVQFRIIQFSINYKTTRANRKEEIQSPLIKKYQEEPQKRCVNIRKDNTIEEMYEFINKNYLKRISVKDVADNVNLNPNYTNTIFREKTGLSIGKFVNMLRIYKAQSLLLTTDWKIIDVALESGFQSLGNFYKMFNAYAKESPSLYRSKHMPQIRG